MPDRPRITVNGCQFPLALHYDVPNHLWYEPLDDGTFRIGMTQVAVALADNRVYAFTPKRPGRQFEKGRSFATIESSKWVGPARAAFDGTVVAVNDSLIDNPTLLTDDPYGTGWMLIGRPDIAISLDLFITGDVIGRAYEDWMRDNDFRGCGPATT